MTECELAAEIGMTGQEAECWELSALLANKFFQLPELHQMDNHEVAHAIHVIQYKLLSRPAYRQYRQLTESRSTVAPDQ